MTRYDVHAGVQMSGWSEVLTRDDWKSITPESGEQSAMIFSTTLMLALSAIVSVVDTGWYWIWCNHLFVCIAIFSGTVRGNMTRPTNDFRCIWKQVISFLTSKDFLQTSMFLHWFKTNWLQYSYRCCLSTVHVRIRLPRRELFPSNPNYRQSASIVHTLKSWVDCFHVLTIFCHHQPC